MAELTWKGKYRIDDKQPFASPPATPYLHTGETFSASAKSKTDEPGTEPTLTDGWHNRLILGDKREVLPALLPEFAERVNLIYIDPPFMTGRNFTSYSDKWNNDLDAYLQWLYETFVLLRLLLANDGSIYVHLDCRAALYARVILD